MSLFLTPADLHDLAGHSTEGMTNRYLRSRTRDEVIGPRFGQSNKTAPAAS